MTRRCVVLGRAGGGRILSREFNGDQSEFEVNRTVNSRDKSWDEIRSLFKNRMRLSDFLNACQEASSYYPPSVDCSNADVNYITKNVETTDLEKLSGLGYVLIFVQELV